MSDVSINNFLATGGTTGCIVCIMYLLYKCLYRKKLRSKCCGGELSISNDIQNQQSNDIQNQQSTDSDKPNGIL